MICKVLDIVGFNICSVIASFVLENNDTYEKFVLTFSKHEFDKLKEIKIGNLIDLHNQNKCVFSSNDGDFIDIVENQDNTQQTNGDALKEGI